MTGLTLCRQNTGEQLLQHSRISVRTFMGGLLNIASIEYTEEILFRCEKCSSFTLFTNSIKYIQDSSNLPCFEILIQRKSSVSVTYHIQYSNICTAL